MLPFQVGQISCVTYYKNPRQFLVCHQLWNVLNAGVVEFVDLMHLDALRFLAQNMPGMPTASKHFLSSISSADASRYCVFLFLQLKGKGKTDPKKHDSMTDIGTWMALASHVYSALLNHVMWFLHLLQTCHNLRDELEIPNFPKQLQKHQQHPAANSPLGALGIDLWEALTILQRSLK